MNNIRQILLNALNSVVVLYTVLLVINGIQGVRLTLRLQRNNLRVQVEANDTAPYCNRLPEVL